MCVYIPLWITVRVRNTYDVHARNISCAYIFHTILRANEIIFFYSSSMPLWDYTFLPTQTHIYAYSCTLNFSFNKKRAIIQTIDLSYTPAYAFFFCFVCLENPPILFLCSRADMVGTAAYAVPPVMARHSYLCQLCLHRFVWNTLV